MPRRHAFGRRKYWTIGRRMATLRRSAGRRGPCARTRARPARSRERRCTRFRSRHAPGAWRLLVARRGWRAARRCLRLERGHAGSRGLERAGGFGGGSAASSAPSPSPSPTGPVVLKVAATANITTWDPIQSFSTEALYLANIYEPLLRINPPSSAEKFTPVLATSWSSSTDGLTWTFQLRDGVTFHDGEKMTSDAVKQSIEAAAARGGASFIWAALDSVTAVDPLTVELKLKYAAPMDLVASSLYGAWIVSPKALAAEAADSKYFETGIDAGTGPYTIESYTPDKEVLLTKYDGYWGGWSDTNHYDKVLISITPEPAVEQQMLDGGQVDLALSLPLENIAAYKDNPDYTFIDEPSYFNYVGFFNTLRKPLDNVLVRQALSYAIPYADIITVGAQGYGTQSHGPVPAGVFPWSADVPQYTQDLDQGQGPPGPGGLPERRVQPEPDVRGREPERGALRAAHQGGVRDARRERHAHADRLQPAVGEGEGRSGRAAGHVPAALLADLRGRRVGQPLVDVPQQRQAVLQPLVLEEHRSSTRWSTTPSASPPPSGTRPRRSTSRR